MLDEELILSLKAEKRTQLFTIFKDLSQNSHEKDKEGA
jgi:hypothetical protein